MGRLKFDRPGKISTHPSATEDSSYRVTDSVRPVPIHPVQCARNSAVYLFIKILHDFGRIILLVFFFLHFLSVRAAFRAYNTSDSRVLYSSRGDERGTLSSDCLPVFFFFFYFLFIFFSSIHLSPRFLVYATRGTLVERRRRVYIIAII